MLKMKKYIQFELNINIFSNKNIMITFDRGKESEMALNLTLHGYKQIFWPFLTNLLLMANDKFNLIGMVSISQQNKSINCLGKRR